MGYNDIEPLDIDFEISCLEKELASLESSKAIYGWGGNDDFEELAIDTDRRIEEVTSQLDSLRLSRVPRKVDEEDF